MSEQPNVAYRVTEIDGVPTVWAEMDGPLRARLTFRVGHADEQPLTRGTTHLVEHLAMHGVQRRRDHSDVRLEATTLNFGLVGDEEHVVERLAAITRRLHALPDEWLPLETDTVRAEAVRRRAGNARDDLLTWRYGATSYGLGAFHEFALGRTTIDELHAWTRRFATRGNAVLMITGGAPPAGLRLHLPEGEYQPPPDPHPSIVPVGSTIPGPNGEIALHAVVDRGDAAVAAGFVLRAQLVDQVRTGRGLADAPPLGYERLTGDCAGLLLTADIVDGRAPEAARAFVGALRHTLEISNKAGLGPRLESYRAAIRQGWSHPGYPYAQVDAAAWDLLHRREPISDEDARARALAVDDAALATALTQVMASALLRLPPSAEQPTGWVAAPLSERPPVTGRRFEPRRDSSLGLTVAESGITRTSRDGSLTVCFEDVVFAVAEKDRRALTGRDGSRVTVDASAWKDGDEAVAEIDRRVPPHLVLSGPVPRTVPHGRFRPPAWQLIGKIEEFFASRQGTR